MKTPPSNLPEKQGNQLPPDEEIPQVMFDDSLMDNEMLSAAAMWDLVKRHGRPKPTKPEAS